jgi:hypothetical protein
MPREIVARALATARLRAVRTHLLSLHKALLDGERLRYEREHGRIDGPQHALRLVLHDPWFAWLRPLAALIVQIDEALAADPPPKPDDLRTFHDHVRSLLQGTAGGEGFLTEYRRALQETPEVVVTHGRLTALLDELK